MPDSRRLPLSHDEEAALRDQQIDVLLDDGLERYFAGRYEDAIHLWTRVLFLDRSHARARAYIDRARTTLAELQRRSDEMLQASRELLERGDTDAARQVLTQADAARGDDVQAAALRLYLERLERVRGLRTDTSEPTAVIEPHGRGSWRHSPRRTFGLGAAAVLVVSVATLFLQSGGTEPAGERPAAVAPVPAKAAVLSSSEVALVRARTLATRGRLSAALVELDRVPVDSLDRTAADQLRIEIQQLLLASARSASATTLTEPVKR